jgi:hypothetical protein
LAPFVRILPIGNPPLDRPQAHSQFKSHGLRLPSVVYQVKSLATQDLNFKLGALRHGYKNVITIVILRHKTIEQ